MSKMIWHGILLAGVAMGQTAGAQTLAAPVAEPGGEMQADVVVTGLRDANASITGTDTPPNRYPQSLRVIDRAIIDRTGATRLDDTIDLAGGVSRQNDFGGLWDKYAIRGFAGNENSGPDILINRFSSNLGFNAPVDVATVERFEFLKAPPPHCRDWVNRAGRSTSSPKRRPRHPRARRRSAMAAGTGCARPATSAAR